jgi:hypothetical protein
MLISFCQSFFFFFLFTVPKEIVIGLYGFGASGRSGSYEPILMSRSINSYLSIYD